MSDTPDTAAAIIDAQRREQQAEARYAELLVRWREAQAEIRRLREIAGERA